MSAADAYTSASKGVGKPAAPIRMTDTEKGKPPVDTDIGAYLKSKIKKDDTSNDTLTTKPGQGGPIIVRGKDSSVIKKAAKDYTKFVKANPVLGGVTSLGAYDLGKGILSKIMNLRGPAVVGGKAGFRSAGR